jgi:hypothetical protein
VAADGGGPRLAVGAVVTAVRERLGDRHHLAVVGCTRGDPAGGEAGELVMERVGE